MSGVSAFASASTSVDDGALRLHRPSPDWRDQIFYFVMTDRFADGDPGNNDQGAGEYKPGDSSRYQGGDLAGLRRQLPYIQGLGATALWITPPVANQWLNPSGDYAGYHGYWAENFMRVDKHLGSLADYQRLSDALHRAGMYLVQDIVVNHTGNYFSYRAGEWDPANPARGWWSHTATPPVARPSQPPFDLNDPRNPAQRRAGIYHWTPDVRDYNDAQQELNFQMSLLDDLNTENPVVRRALRRSYGHWIREVGVDAFRVDTAFYVPPDFFDGFLHARDPAAPGIAEVARRTGRRDFLVFGEGFGIDRPGDDQQARKIERYMHGEGGRPLLGGMLNFPLYGALGDAFARGRAPAALGASITQMLRLHPRLHWMPSFVDNHDVDRFLAGGSPAAFRQALLALMTLPGIPVIYYGSEQGFTAPRASMFAAGAGSGGRDHFDRSAPLYRAIAAMAALRRGDLLFSRGTPTVLAANAARPGALVWRTDHEGRSALVVFNTADHEVLLAGLDSGLAGGRRLQGLHGLDGPPADEQLGPDGRLTLRLPPRAGWVWLAVPASDTADGAAAVATTAAPTLQLPSGPAAFDGDFGVTGRAPPAARLRLVVDGDLAAAQEVQADAAGRWQATVDTAEMVDPGVRHDIVAWAGGRAASKPAAFQVRRQWREVVDQADPEDDDHGDDHGTDGRLVYPTDPGWGSHRQLDLRRVRVATSGGALRLSLTMADITTSWNPPNGFDHVAFTVYLELPGEAGGSTLMPLQDGSLPDGMRWHRRLRVGGWSNALFSDEGATADREGQPMAQAAALSVDRAARTVHLTLPAAALGRRTSLQGTRILVTTWDYDGGYRPLTAQPGPYAFGGPPGSPKVMDSSAVLRLP